MEEKKEEPVDLKKGRMRTQTLVNSANIVDNADGQLLPSLYKPIGESLGFGIEQLGAITAVRSLLQAVTTPFWGWLADRYSRKIILAIGCIFWGVFTIILGALNEFWGFLFVRAFIGIGLAVIVPTSQSLIADYFPESKRGKAFGYLGLTGVIGAIVGTLYATSIGEIDILGLEGWRFSFYTIGAFSVLLGGLIWIFGKDPIRGKSDEEIGALVSKKSEKKYAIKFNDLKKILTNKTFLLIVLQGVAGSIPWNSIFFTVLWFEYIGFDAAIAGIAFAVIAIGAALGNLFGGFLGDIAARKMPKYGRIMVAQISVFLGIPMMFVIFLAIPRVATTTYLILFIIVGLITGFMISWCAPAANNPIFSELFEPEIRSTAFSVDRLFEGAVAASGTWLVAILATRIFNYVDPLPGQKISEMLPGDIANNIDAIAFAMLIATCVPWLICMIAYSFVYLTYPKDREKIKQALQLRKAELQILESEGESNQINEKVEHKKDEKEVNDKGKP